MVRGVLQKKTRLPDILHSAQRVNKVPQIFATSSLLSSCNVHIIQSTEEKTIIPVALIGDDKIIINSTLRASLVIYMSYPAQHA